LKEIYREQQFAYSLKLDSVFGLVSCELFAELEVKVFTNLDMKRVWSPALDDRRYPIHYLDAF